MKSSWKFMISFCYFREKIELNFEVAHAGYVFAQIGS